MDRQTRNSIERATQRARRLLEEDFASQLEGTFDILPSGSISSSDSASVPSGEASRYAAILAAIERKRSGGLGPAEAVADYLRDAAFTTLNRFVALKMLEARGLVQQCVSRGEQSSGYAEFAGMAPGLVLLPDGRGYRVYIESLFDELSTEVKVLFDRSDPATVLWPRRSAFAALLEVFNAADLVSVWGEDETIGWVYQFFNDPDERQKMRDESQAPRNSRELAVRNQFFTPRYVVQFLVDNTLGRTWLEMHGEGTRLAKTCEYLVRPIDEPIGSRPRKDPRDLRILDPACGSGHFLLYTFDLLLTIYEEAWALVDSSPNSDLTGRPLREDYPDLAQLREAAPGLILEHNLYGVDIDARCAQIAALALWLRVQRAYQELGIAAESRPRIQGTHIVIAEPMPESPDLADAFAAELERPFQRTLFDRMIQEMRLAGELGTLLQVELSLADDISRARRQFLTEQPTLFPELGPKAVPGTIDLSGVTDETVFQDAEETILDALRRFAASAGGANARRRLFAGDAAQGVALIDLVRTRFDVILMNPPFGEPTPSTKQLLNQAYPRSKADLYAMCVERGVQLLASAGMVGAITSRTGFFLKRLETWRSEVLLGDCFPTVLADFGGGVLDGATVETACFALAKSCPQQTTFLQMEGLEDISRELRSEIRSVATSSPSPRVHFVHAPDFKKLPESKWLFWIGPTINRAFLELPSLRSRGYVAAAGLQTNDDFRFVRTAWEVDHIAIGPQRKWAPFFKGGEFSPFFDDIHLVVQWDRAGYGIKQHTITMGNSPSRHVVNESLYFRPGIGYINISSIGFSPQLLPEGVVFSIQGQFLGGPSGPPPLWIMGASVVSGFLDLINPGRHYQAGQVQLLPLPAIEDASTELESAAMRIAELKLVEASWCEESRYFEGPPIATQPGSVRLRITACRAFLESVCDEIRTLQREIDHAAARAYALDSQDRAYIDTDTQALRSHPGSVFISSLHMLADAKEQEPWLASSTLQWALGRAFGRWRTPQASSAVGGPALPRAIPAAPPALREGNGSDRHPRILVDDVGHPSDVCAHLEVALSGLLEDDPIEAGRDLANTASGGSAHDLREWLAKEMFGVHLSTYSKSRRRAPIYWQLATRSASYSAWLYLHAFTSDTFYRLQNDFVAPKLAHEERRLEEMRTEYGHAPTVARTKTIGVQEALIDELRTLLEDVRRVAPLWSPDLDDGVIVNFAPLWRLVPHQRAWQKELKATWDELCAGKHDWAHLAMHLWAERVVPKCMTDRSLAIAHGLEEVFWVEGVDGKWTRRPIPTRPIDEVVAERTSPAVKAALAGLLETTSQAGGAGRRGRNTGVTA